MPNNTNSEKSLTKQDKKIVKKIRTVMENKNTQYIIREQDFRTDFQRNLLDPVFELKDNLQLPSQKIMNSYLISKVEQFVCLLEQLRYLIAFKGGPSKYGKGSYIIDFPEDQDQCNELCNSIWNCYSNIVETYKKL